MAAVGEGGIRFYTAPPLGPDRSELARVQARLWADPTKRVDVARRMYAWRLGEVLPHRDIAVLRGIEGARMKETYKITASRFGIRWEGRRYDRADPASADAPNQAINHAATAVQAAAAIAVTSLSALPQLGFIHEDSDQAFVLDIADLFRDHVTLPIAFGAAKESQSSQETIDRLVRRKMAATFRQKKVIPTMIERIKDLIDEG